jgi:hypothetical protein
MRQTLAQTAAPETLRQSLLYQITEHRFRLHDLTLKIGEAYLDVGGVGSVEARARLTRAEQQAREMQSQLHALRLQVRGLTS